jgi:hypothetical protein
MKDLFLLYVINKMDHVLVEKVLQAIHVVVAIEELLVIFHIVHHVVNAMMIGQKY